MSIESIRHKVSDLRHEANLVQRHISILAMHGERSSVLDKRNLRIGQQLRMFETIILLNNVEVDSDGEQKM